MIALLVAGLAAYGVYAPIAPPAVSAGQGSSADTAVYVDIAPGTGTQQIAAMLERAQILRSRYAFYLLRLVKGGRLQAGEYRFSQPATALDVYTRLVRGDVFTIPVTVPEGYNIFDIAQAVAATGLAPRDSFLAAERADTSLIADLSPHAASLEGFLFPDTYRFPRTATPEQILAAMVRRFRQATRPLDLSPERTLRIVILASLIEKEVARDSERPLVAGVFANRLARAMPLATDPSVIYAALLDGRYSGTIYASDLRNASPYNTYLHAGLPPGPVANPGLAALRAAISPAVTDYLYFVADAQGQSVFSATLAQHNEQVQQYRRATGHVSAPASPAPRSPGKKHTSSR